MLAGYLSMGHKPGGLRQRKLLAVAGDETQLVIAPIILDEIDKHKNHLNARTAKRAKMIADKFDQYLDGKPGKITLHFIKMRPIAFYFEQNQLDQKHQDDCLLAAILQFKDEHLGADIRLVTDDLGVKMRAGTLNIQIIKLAADFRLPEQVDEKIKLIEKLKAEVSKLKDRIPEIKLRFQDHSSLISYKIPLIEKTLEEHVKKEMHKIKTENPLMKTGETEIDNNSIFALMEKLSGGVLTNERKEKYNTELEQYYREYQIFLRLEYNYQVEHLLFVKLEFELVNEGNTPAEDIDVWIHLPDGFEVVSEYPKKPNRPEPPFRPKNNYDFQPFNSNLLNLDFALSGRKPSLPNPDMPTIKKTNSYEITYHCRSLKHGMLHKFDYILVRYTSFKEMKSFELDYRLIAGNVPHQVSAKLNIVFERSV